MIARRLAPTMAMVVVLFVAAAPPASAHTIAGVQATNYRSEITAVTPSVPGVTVKVRDLGRRVELTNTTNEDVVVQGYQNEPYLRVGPTGVFENRRSPSLYQNKITTGSSSLVQLPPEADPSAAPDWRKRDGGHTVSWHDRRTRWEGADPPAVKANPGVQQTVVTRWTVALQKGPSQASIVVTGRITWVPGPAVAPWLITILALFALAMVGGALAVWPTVLSAMVAVLLAVDMVRLFGAATAAGGSLIAGLAKALVFGILEVAAWVGGVWAISSIQRKRAVGLYLAMAVGVVIGFISGVGDLLNLAYSQVPTTLPPAMARLSVAVCIGAGFGIVGGSFLALRRLGVVITKAAPPSSGLVRP